MLLTGDAREVMSTLPAGSVDCVVTSPPYYGLRDYGMPGQYGREPTLAEYVATMRDVFREARRVLAGDGTLWLNLGDSYNTYPANRGPSKSFSSAADPARETLPKGWGLAEKSLPNKSLMGVPWRVAFALQDDGWTLRNEIVWHKPNGLPENVRDRMSKRHEHVFLFTKGPRYFFDLDAVREPYTGDRAPSRRAHHGGNKENTARGRWTDTGRGRNPGSVWSISTRPYPEAHFATFPLDLPVRCIKAGCRPGGHVLDPFSGAGTTGVAALSLGRTYTGIDLNPAYHELAVRRGVPRGNEKEGP